MISDNSSSSSPLTDDKVNFQVHQQAKGTKKAEEETVVDLEEENTQDTTSKPNQVEISVEKPSPGYLVLPTIVFSQFAGTSLWFAPNAVLSQVEGFGDRELALLTSLVQLGFIFGTLGLSIFSIADRFEASIVFGVFSILGACFNAICITTTNAGVWGFLRFLVGICEAGIYPVGMKVAAKHYPEGLGARLGVLVGALTLGTAFPWLIRGIGDSSGALPFKATLVFVSVLALLGGLLMPIVILNKHLFPELKVFFSSCVHGGEKSRKKQNFLLVLQKVTSDRLFCAAAMGYFGHQFELYTFWSFAIVLIEANADVNGGSNVLNSSLTTFCAIGIGAVTASLVGLLSLIEFPQIKNKGSGSAVAGIIPLFISGCCCLLAPAYKLMSPVVFFVYILVWGASVIPDSAMFTSLSAMNAPKEYVGTALTIVTCVGFTITIISIQIIGAMNKAGIDIGFALMLLSVGPLIGIISSYRQWPVHHIIFKKSN